MGVFPVFFRSFRVNFPPASIIVKTYWVQRLPRDVTCIVQSSTPRYNSALQSAKHGEHRHHWVAVLSRSMNVASNPHSCDIHTTVEPLTNDHPHQRPSLSYDHISCDGLWFMFVYKSLTSDHPSYTTTPMCF